MGKKKDKRTRAERDARSEPVSAPTPAPVEPERAPAWPDGRPAAVAAASPPPPAVTVAQRPGRVLPPPPPGAPVAVAAREVISRIAGATLCYGEPVHVGDRAVIPAARVRARGGMGFGGRVDADGGGGGGGAIDAAPAGFIQIGPDGASYEAIPRARSGGRAAGAALVAGAAAGVAGAVFASVRRRSVSTGTRGRRRRLGR